MDHGDRALREALEIGLSTRTEKRASIEDLKREPFSGATAYSSEILTVGLSDGRVLKVFLKDFRSSRLPKDEPVARCQRELGVYRDLLSQADLGTAEFYGWVETEIDGRHQLLLEFVDGLDLRSSEFPSSWVRAAAWLARLHGSSASEPERIAASNYLVRHDAEFFTSRAEAAVQTVSELSEALGAWLRSLLEGYDDIVEAMVTQPRTLVHGSFRPTNILVGPGSTRIVPVDWELAAVGAPLYDLAFLSDGFQPPDLDSLLGTYRRHADREGVPVPDPEKLRYLLDCFRLHKVVKWLSESALLGFSRRTVEKLLNMAGRLGERLRAP